jgi:carboxyl-terminal processing protease
MKTHAPLIVAASLLALLSGCGGGGDKPNAVATTPSPAIPPPFPAIPTVPPPPAVAEWTVLANHCEIPRLGTADVRGTLMDELKWLRSYYDETYLWYRELPTNLRLENYTRAVEFFNVYKTSAVTASGLPKDRFHFTYPTDVWNGLSSSGVEVGYGIAWVRNDDSSVWTVATVAPASPAALAGVRRGDGLASVDGVPLSDNSGAAVNRINAGLFPSTAGQTHQLALTRGGVALTVNLMAQQVASPPVQNVMTIDTPTGKVGYLQFDDHNQLSESELAKAISSLKSANVADLVLDMRYNGGGYLAVASELAYMIAGPQATSGKAFERQRYNDKTPLQAPQPFLAKAFGFKGSQLAANTALPYLGLKRVTILTTAGTCSASESVINGLRGIDVEVNLIGGETCGKPYGFVPADNCGTTYFAIQMQGSNHKGFGDYVDGFQPTCRAADDFGHALGDTSERLLSAALSYRANGVCPAPSAMNRALAGAAGAASGAMTLVRPQAKEIAIRVR